MTVSVNTHPYLYNLISSQSGYLEGRRSPEMALQQYLSTLLCLPLPSRNLQTFLSILWSSHLFFCLSLLLTPFTIPCRIVFTTPKDLEIWLYHLSFLFLPMLGDSQRLQLHSRFCCDLPCSSHGLCRKCSEVSCSISISKGLDPSLDFWCQGPAITDTKEGG